VHDPAVDVSSTASRVLARRSSRRQFFKFLSAGSLGTGLWLTRTDVSLGAVSGCAGCGGGPCNPCYSACPICDNLNPPRPCRPCHLAGGYGGGPSLRPGTACSGGRFGPTKRRGRDSNSRGTEWPRAVFETLPFPLSQAS